MIPSTALPRPPPSFLHLLLLLLLHVLLCPPLPAAAHQSVSFPTPISRDVACRIGFSQNCPGPCPRRDLRGDMNKDNPSIITERAGWIALNTMANNHRGGFSRWSLVHVRDMYNKQKHAQNAFLFSCADLNLAKCTRRNFRRDCNYDRKNEYYRHSIQIPLNIPDGVYVLGWVWYGGGERWGLFGDYYDCVFIRIQGGPTAYVHRPQFRPGNSFSGRYGKCRATVNRVGICWREPCPGGGRYTTLQKPFEFTNRIPPLIPRSRFLNPYRPRPRPSNGAFVISITIRSADVPSRIYTSSTRGRYPYVFLLRRMRTTVTAETSGAVRSVTFYINGRQGRTDYGKPYSIAGDWVEYRTKRVRYAPWQFEVDRRIFTLSAKAVGWKGDVHWRTMEVSTDV